MHHVWPQMRKDIASTKKLNRARKTMVSQTNRSPLDVAVWCCWHCAQYYVYKGSSLQEADQNTTNWTM